MSNGQSKKITKAIFLESMTCLTKGWYLYHRDVSPAFTAGEQLRIDEGREIGELARQLYPEGILIDEHGSDAVDKTKELISSNTKILFEASFTQNGFATRADILIHEEDGWHLVEVKSSTDYSLKSKKDQSLLIDDMAYTLMVIGGVIPITKISIMTISKDFRLGMDLSKLFVISDVTSDVQSRTNDFNSTQSKIETALRASTKPNPSWIYPCKLCEFFKNECLGQNIQNPIFNLPRITEKRCAELFALSCYDIISIPEDYALTDKQTTVRDVTNSGKVFVSPDLSDTLSDITWPAYYLDFETIKTAYPLYSNVAPHEQVLTQYSLHKLNDFNQQLVHNEYLADPKQDCRRELAEKLLACIGTCGSIIVYSPFEKTMLTSLKKQFIDLSDQLDAVIHRLVDLKTIIEKNYYHPGFHGSYSIKSVLPVLVPHMSYDNLDVKNGDEAIATFVKMIKHHSTNKKCSALRKQLLAYCRQDTLAMVELHKAILKLAEGCYKQK